MSAVNETLVREYFELHGFFVRQARKFIAPQLRDDDEADFFVVHPAPRQEPPPFILQSDDLPRLGRAIVVVKPWHTDTFTPGLLANAPEIFRFLEPAALAQSAKAFPGEGRILRVLVLPALPKEPGACRQSISLLKAKGVDAVLLFRPLLQDLITSVETNRNYQKSDVLQLLRILKNYEFLREPQLELFKTTGKKARKTRRASA
jgi:hypothetical protein